MQSFDASEDPPSGMPEGAPEPEPLGPPDADPGGERTPPGPDTMPGIPTEEEPPAAS